MKNIKVSTIIPVYKVSLEHLQVCLDSLANQTMLDCEFIIVGDGAPEAETSVCNEYVKKDSRFRFFRNEHQGVSTARNFGIDQAQGEYVTFVDADDWIAPETCQIVYNYAKECGSDIVLWDAYIHKEKNNRCTQFAANSLSLFSKKQIEGLIRKAIFPSEINESSAAFVSCKLVKRKILREHHIFFPTQLHCSEDRFFHIQCFLYGVAISYIKKPLYYYRIHNDSVSRKYTPNAFLEYTKFMSYLAPDIQEKYSTSIDLEYIHSFFLSWPTCYMNKNNKESYLKRMHDLIQIVKSDKFVAILKRIDLKNFSFLIKLELLLFKKGVTLPIYLHGIKALLVPYK